MALEVKHKFASAKTDGTDATLIQPSNWNDTHDITLASGNLLGRSTAGAGSAEEISIGSGLSLSGGVLSATGSGSGASLDDVVALAIALG